MIYIPVEILLPWLMKLSRNRTYLYVGRILILTLVTLSAIGCAADWITPIERDLIGCRLAKYECYYGAPLGLLDFINIFEAPQPLLWIPIVALLSAILLLFMPPRTYLLVIILYLGVLLIFLFFSEPAVLMNYYFGAGQRLVEIAMVLIVILCLPLAVAEHAEIIKRRNSLFDFLED